MSRSTTATNTTLRPIGFADLKGWVDDDHHAALTTFRRGIAAVADHPPKLRPLGPDPRQLTTLLRRADALHEPVTDEDARAFFEDAFVPHDVVPPKGPAHFTGYYEPDVAGSRVPSDAFPVPLHARPDDLVEIVPGSATPPLDPQFRFARKAVDGGHIEYDDRRAIMQGALDGRGLELAYVADAVEAFFIHVQGAARIRLAEGGTLRVTYAAKSGHPYTPIGRVLIDRGALPAGGVTMRTIRDWLAAHRQERDAVLAENRSYIFFREVVADDPELGPIAAAKVPLTAGRSLAVDRTLHAFHAPVWVETVEPDGTPFHRLMVAQDTGSAIVGPARGDIFFGSGDDAGEIAGATNASGRFVLFKPRETGH